MAAQGDRGHLQRLLDLKEVSKQKHKPKQTSRKWPELEIGILKRKRAKKNFFLRKLLSKEKNQQMYHLVRV